MAVGTAVPFAVMRCGLSLVFLPTALNNSFVTLSIFAAFYGLGWFATLPPTIRLTTSTFGPTLGPLVFGWMCVHTGVAPPPPRTERGSREPLKAPMLPPS